MANLPLLSSAGAVRRRASRGALLLLVLVCDLLLLRSLLTSAWLSRGEILRLYFEPGDPGVALFLDDQQAGYMTEVEVGPAGDLAVPSGRNVAVPLDRGEEYVVRTLAPDLSPYVALAFERPLPRLEPGGANEQAARVADPLVLSAGATVLGVWDATRPWREDRAWLAALRARCGSAASGEMRLSVGDDAITLRLGSCEVARPLAADSGRPLAVIVTGMYGATVASPGRPWRQEWSVSRQLVAVAAVRAALLCAAIGPVPAALASAALLLSGALLRPAAILVWVLSLPFVAAAAAARLARRLAPRRAWLGWAVAALVLGLQIGAAVAAVALLDIGSFGKERVTRSGDDACSVVGYSTVRGDSLRAGTEGVVERLGDSCDRCRDRTSRFSREAQTLRWVREVVCAPTFPTPAGGEVVFLGGGNDDVFYRPGRLTRVLGVYLNLLLFTLRPVDAMSWEAAFTEANRLVLPTVNEQAADIAAIAGCARGGGRRFWFVHDFLLWDIENGRSPDRQRTFMARRGAVAAAGGDFVDLYEAFAATAGVSWFNDWIHPSGFGQRMIADLLCRRLADAAVPAPE